jgi:hypothetical protein
MIVFSPWERVTAMVIDEHAAAQLADAIRGHRAGNVEVVDVRTDIRFSPARGEYLLVELVLSPPVPGADTWPQRHTSQLREDARTHAAQLGFPPEAVTLSLVDSSDAGRSDDPPLTGPRWRTKTGEPDDS